MKLSRAVILGVVMLFGTATFAQDYAKVEVPMQYSYMRFNPENSHIISGLSLNGGGGGVTVYVNHSLAVFYCTSFPKASCPSATSVSWPTGGAPSFCRFACSCWAQPQNRLPNNTLPPPMTLLVSISVPTVEDP